MKMVGTVLTSVGLTLLSAGGIFIYFLLNMDKFETLLRILLKILTLLVPIKKLRNKHVAFKIQNLINIYAEEIEKKALEFEEKHGPVNFLKLAGSSLNMLLVKKGLVTEEELLEAFDEELKAYNNGYSDIFDDPDKPVE